MQACLVCSDEKPTAALPAVKLPVVLQPGAEMLLMPAAVLLLDVLLLAVLQLDATKKWRKVVPNCLWMLS